MSRNARPLILFAAASAALLTACSSGSDAPAAEEDVAAGASSAAENGAAGSPGGDATGVLTVAGGMYTFTPDWCLISSSEAGEFIVSGPGFAADSTPVYVDAAGPNQLTVYVGTDDRFGQAEVIYEFNPLASGGGPLDELGGLTIDGNTVYAEPVMVGTDANRTEFEPVGTAAFEATCA